MATPVADYGQAQALVSQQTQAFQNLLNSQKDQQQGLFNQYSSASAAQPHLVDVLNNAQQQAGIGGLQQGINLFNTQATDVKGLIDRLNENTQSRTVGTNANQAYLDRMRAVEGGGLNTQLSRLTSGLGDVTAAYNTANANTGQLLSATQADQATALHPLELQINAIGDRFAREITGFTTNKQDELNVLLDKLQAQQALNDREWQAAQSLSSQANDYAQRLSLINAQNKVDAGKATATVNSSQQNAYNDVKTRVGSGNVAAIKSDYAATLKSANFGNQGDKYKIEAYKQLRPDLFGGSQSSAPSNKSYNIFSDQGAKNLSNAVTNKASGIGNSLLDRLQNNAKVFGF